MNQTNETRILALRQLIRAHKQDGLDTTRLEVELDELINRRERRPQPRGMTRA